MRLIIYSVLVAGLSGCATAQLTPAGQTAKLVEPDFIDAAKCKSIITVMFSNEMTGLRQLKIGQILELALAKGLVAS